MRERVAAAGAEELAALITAKRDWMIVTISLRKWAASAFQSAMTRLKRGRKTVKRTIVYIDGYNLYYGRLRGTEFKWLDVVKLCVSILAQQDPASRIVAVRFFTAPALGKFASHGNASVSAQQQYHRALTAVNEGILNIVLGSHSFNKSGIHAYAFLPGRVFDKTQKRHVWKIEEKQTDVNIALRAYRDASKGLADQVVFVTNDSDIEPAMKAIKEDFPRVYIGSIMPIAPVASPAGHQRRASVSLSNLANWTRHSISDGELASAQLPTAIATAKRPIVKPTHW